MFKSLVTSAALLVCSTTTLFAQFGGTAQQATAGAAQGTGQTSGMSATAFSPFSFDPAFGATAITNTMGATGGVGGLGGLGRTSFGMGGLGGFGMGGMGRGGMGNTSQNQNQSKIRTTVKLGFRFAGPSPQLRTREMNATLARLPLPTRFSGLRVEMDGNTAVVSGKVESADDVRLVKQLMLLEPGVEDVDTKLLQTSEQPELEQVPAPIAE